MHNSRRQRQLEREGINTKRIETLARSYLADMQNNEITLKEAKLVIEKMACILRASERYRPETPLKDIPIRMD